MDMVLYVFFLFLMFLLTPYPYEEHNLHPLHLVSKENRNDKKYSNIKIKKASEVAFRVKRRQEISKNELIRHIKGIEYFVGVSHNVSLGILLTTPPIFINIWYSTISAHD